MDADAKFKKATYALSAYENKYHPRVEAKVTERMALAKAMDKSSSKPLKRLKESWRPLKEEPTTVVEFLLHKSLPDKNPTIVKQVLYPSSRMNEILWNFIRYKGRKHLTLKDNPHFYENLPTSAKKYDGDFQISSIIPDHHHMEISVLTAAPRLTGRVFLETAKGKRAFANVWVPKHAIIFQDVCGKLEGENIIGSAIENTPNLWCFEEEHSLSNASWPSLPDRSSSSPTTTATPITSPTGALLGDWREPILRMLRSQDPGVDITFRILDKSPTSFNSGHSGASLPSPPPNSSTIVGSLSPRPEII
ncbi:hypothetical protein F5888DRAFT_1707236 [Russula emetica]|nr:hypothetical protein F5888DRAFT_1707236 [Russula emetica]